MRDRFNARQFISWLQDVDDKYDRMKVSARVEDTSEVPTLAKALGLSRCRELLIGQRESS